MQKPFLLVWSPNLKFEFLGYLTIMSLNVGLKLHFQSLLNFGQVNSLKIDPSFYIFHEWLPATNPSTHLLKFELVCFEAKCQGVSDVFNPGIAEP